MIYADKLQKTEKRLAQIEHEISQPEVVKDQAKYQKLTKEMAEIRPLVGAYAEYRRAEEELAALSEELNSKKLDAEMRDLYREEEKSLKQKKDALLEQIETMLIRDDDPRSGRDVIAEIRAGTGGEEAALFVADLFRMYSRYASSLGLRLEVMDSNPTGIGGFKEVIFAVSGSGAYAKFKYESGIHRVQRVPATEASGRVHTSAVTVAIMAEADETEINIDPADLKIDVYRASGAGGQHVNKTESAVRITHLPSGVIVQCQDERSQHKNKARAMRVLRARLYEAEQERRQLEQSRERKAQIGSGDRSGKIRTYNYPDQRVTDHRIGLTLHSLNDILNGHLDEMVGALERDERNRKLMSAA
ncbi:MAG: peptide chain release factor 1 [Candidatus Omnitrophica bacterium]|nr:peptide chain release factor 1 [Candidatus Omnitrophota bacterium]